MLSVPVHSSDSMEHHDKDCKLIECNIVIVNIVLVYIGPFPECSSQGEVSRFQSHKAQCRKTQQSMWCELEL